MLAALRRKERAPESIGITELCGLAAPVIQAAPGPTKKRARETARRFLDQALSPLELIDRFPAFHRVRYEDFVDHRLNGLETYLGFPVPSDFELAPKHRKVLRAGRYGTWVDWFTEADRPLLDAPTIGRIRDLGFTSTRPTGHVPRIDPE